MTSTIIWITGQPGSGKTTLANALVERFEYGTSGAVLFDGDDLRRTSFNFDYSEAGRRRNIRHAQRLAATAQVSIVIVAMVSPYRDLRELLKSTHPRVIECYTHRASKTSKDRYHVANYEPPLENFVDLDTDALSLTECVERVMQEIQRRS